MRITEKMLENLARDINKITESPDTTYTKNNDGTFTANIGNYHISYAYGGAALHRISNEHGGVLDVFYGHMPKRDLYNRMAAWVQGYEMSKY